MILLFPARTRRDCLLVGSDQPDRTAARREIARWAAEQAVSLPNHPQRLALVEDNHLVSEWIVLEGHTLASTGSTPPRKPAA